MTKLNLNEMIGTKIEAAVFIASLYPEMTTIDQFESLVCTILEDDKAGKQVTRKVFSQASEIHTDIIRHCVNILEKDWLDNVRIVA